MNLEINKQGNAIIKVSNLYKSYKTTLKDIVVLKGLNFEIRKGEFTIIFGPSGSGKSTLLNNLMGLEEINNGEITIDNFSISHNSVDSITKFRKERIGIVYQQPYWIKSLDVLGNIAFPLMLRGIPKYEALPKALELLTSFELAEWASLKPTELSAGQQQKVSLARALITNPDIIVADEPTGNLDFKSGQDLTYQLKELAKAGKTIIMVTHNLDNLDYADRVLRILDGEIVDDIKLTKENLATEKAKLITNTDILDKKQKNLPTEVINEQKARFKFSFRKNFIVNLPKSILNVFFIISLTILSLVYKLIYSLFDFKFLPQSIGNIKYRIENLAIKISNIVNKNNRNSLRHLDIFDLSLKNLFSKKSRAVITIGGIALGIGFTTLLISFGFGLEKLVLERVANLEELKEIDVFPAVGDSIEINDEVLEVFKNIENTTEVYPVVTMAGNISFQDSNTDVVVYGADSEYLTKTSHTFIDGVTFNDEYQTVVNLEFLNLIGVSTDDLLNNELEVKFIPTGDLLNEDSEFDLEAKYKYKIVGIVDYKDTPIIFTPLEDIQSLGITEYTQARIVATNEDVVPEIRTELNALGYRSNSILDTVNEISSFFSTARIVFATVGFVALFVASLGMFNTLTVSLLERIREVGLMKAIGMSNREVKDLFLTEAMTMAILGGVLGIIFGLVVGNIISLVLSSFAITSGFEYINVIHLPVVSMLLILLVAGLTGALTGFYPAKRATNISALDALRYE